MVTENLISAFKNTDYHVLANEHFVLHIDEFNEKLQDLHEEYDANSSAFLTAYCPFSKPLSLEENEILQTKLETELKSLSLQFVNGYGQGRGEYSNWKERSVLVLNISFEEAYRLSKKYEQYAFVWNAKSSNSSLVLVDFD